MAISKNIKDNIPDYTTLIDASLMMRFKAFLTDTFMITMPLIYISFYFIMGSREEFEEDKIIGWIYIIIPHFILIISLWFFKQQTPGLKAYELSVVDDITFKKPSLVSLINRYIQTFISIIFVFPLFLPYFRKDRKTLQDLISRTCIKITPNKVINQKDN